MRLLFLSVFAIAIAAVTPALAERLDLTVASARQSFDSQTTQPVVSITLNEESALAFGAFTEANIGKIVDLYVDGEVVTSPVIMAPITGGELQIGGGSMMAEEAVELAMQLDRGGVPIWVELRD